MDVQKLNTVDTSRLLKLIENISNERAEKTEKAQTQAKPDSIRSVIETAEPASLPLPAVGRFVNIWA